ncbi:MAG: hypothetical protein CMJ83_17380 [Planctomycetes bacterium]|nr:hypothetical protein [Planctomycetota bacterium]
MLRSGLCKNERDPHRRRFEIVAARVPAGAALPLADRDDFEAGESFGLAVPRGASDQLRVVAAGLQRRRAGGRSYPLEADPGGERFLTGAESLVTISRLRRSP